MKITVSGKYRFDLPGATEQGLKPYEVSFSSTTEISRGELLVRAAKLMKAKDPYFDSFKTHDIKIEDEKNVARK